MVPRTYEDHEPRAHHREGSQWWALLVPEPGVREACPVPSPLGAPGVEERVNCRMPELVRMKVSHSGIRAPVFEDLGYPRVRQCPLRAEPQCSRS